MDKYSEIRKLKWKDEEMPDYYISSDGVLYFGKIDESHRCATNQINGRNYCYILFDHGMMAKRIDYMVAYTFHGNPEDAIRLIHINEQIDDDRAENLMWFCKSHLQQEYIDKAIIEPDGTIIEQWKPITLEYNSKINYEINNFGIVRNCKTGERVKTYTNHGYEVFYYLDESPSKQTRLKLVHRCVAEAFLPNPNKYQYINHIDGNKSNNMVNNLEWSESGMNVEHAYLQRLNQNRKYTPEQIHTVCDLLAHRKISHVQISYMTGVDRKTISDIYIGRRWTEISSKYVFQPKRWTPEIKQKIKDLTLKGYVIKEICQILNEPYEQAIISLYERLRRELRAEGKL